MGETLLETINSTADLKKIKEDDLPKLCEEIRSFMIESVSRTGGHLASSLGAVELIVAIHYVFNSPEDKIVFDVGHQSYAHKILTGRREQFSTLRQDGGISGFPKREESEHDAFNTGHASTAVSAALGFARAMRIEGKKGMAVALVGDGSMTGGLTFEAMDDAGNDGIPFLIVLNDNEMSISQNVGGVTRNFAKLRTGRMYNAFKRSLANSLDTTRYGRWLGRHMSSFKNRIKHFLIPNLPFEEIGFTYIGPINGHDIKTIIKYLRRVQELKRPVILHAITQKGRGYSYALENPEKFHGIAPFSIETGEVNSNKRKSCSEVFGSTLIKLAEKDKRIVAITAAMPTGTGLASFAEQFKERFFDVGIAEEHAVTMAAGFAAEGMRPVVAVYSSFLQRAYDELLHDVCLQNLPVVIALDRAGLVGEDGETHQGIYDPAFLQTMPNLVVYSPASMEDLSEMLAMALDRKEPSVIRYNRGTLPDRIGESPIEFGKWEIMLPPQKVTLFATGTLLPIAEKIARENHTGLVSMRFLKPIDRQVISQCAEAGTKMLVLEENIAAVAPLMAMYANPAVVRSAAIPNMPVSHATVDQQRKRYGLTEDHIVQMIKELEEM
ncbi:MAG: 1-deoxy-D-xylulose-5-phosphate synthase [Clostridia bacterium]|nr:1-deoxy-D-xylulose-5-phosphate synthase [Clostridia bacterium]